MNNIKINISAGGVFSKIMFGIQNCENININFDNLYFNNIDNRFKNDENINVFNYIYDQNESINYNEYFANHLGNYSKFNKIEYSNKLNNYKFIISKLKFTNELEEKIKNYLDKYSLYNSIGVHIRLTDMNIYHANDYGVLSFDDFDNKLSEIEKNYENIFVASDNEESLEKLIKKYGSKIKFIDNLFRASREDDDLTKIQEENKLYSTKKIWTESFCEMMLLSKCSKLICRSSNLSNAAIIYSNTLKEVITL